MKKLLSFSLSLFVLIAFSATISSCQQSKISSLKRDIKHANAQCPIPLMDIGQIYSIGFDDKNNSIVYNVELTDDYYFNAITDNWANKYNALKSVDKQFIKKLSDINIGMKYRYKYGNQSKEITITANDIKNFFNSPLPDEDLLNQLIEVEKSTFPVVVDEGTTIVDAIIEDNNVICIVEIDEGIYDIDGFITLMTEDEESFKQSVVNDPTLKKNLGIFKRTNTNLIYRYKGNISQKYFDITITPDEM